MVKTDKPFMDILDYVLLKSMPHKLLLINNTTKRAYFTFKQELLKQYDLKVSEHALTDVAEL
ncbi:MAG: hypothetical protein ACREBU_08780 [Nitrososphaera sp.]